MITTKLGLQLATVGSEAQTDLPRTLRAVAAIGYDGVALDSLYGASPERLRELLESLKLATIRVASSLPELELSLQRVAVNSRLLGTETLTVGPERRQNVAGWRELARRLELVGRATREHGLCLVYRLGEGEFIAIDGDRNAWDILRDETDPQFVRFELDTLVTARGGGDPNKTLRRYTARCPLVSVRDAVDREQWRDAELGEGVLGVRALLRAASPEWLMVAHASSERPPLQAAAIALRNLRALTEGVSKTAATPTRRAVVAVFGSESRVEVLRTRSEYELRFSPKGDALTEADYVLFAPPSALPHLKKNALLLCDHPNFEIREALVTKKDVACVAVRGCQPPLGGSTKQAVIAALLHGKDTDYRRAERLAKLLFSPVSTVHRVTVDQFVALTETEADLAAVCTKLFAQELDPSVVHDVLVGQLSQVTSEALRQTETRTQFLPERLAA